MKRWCVEISEDNYDIVIADTLEEAEEKALKKWGTFICVYPR